MELFLITLVITSLNFVIGFVTLTIIITNISEYINLDNADGKMLAALVVFWPLTIFLLFYKRDKLKSLLGGK